MIFKKGQKIRINVPVNPHKIYYEFNITDIIDGIAFISYTSYAYRNDEIVNSDDTIHTITYKITKMNEYIEVGKWKIFCCRIFFKY